MAQLSPVALILIVISILIPIFYTLYQKNLVSKVAPVALKPQQYQKFKLQKKTEINHNVIMFRFALQSPLHKLGLPTGQHMYLRFYDKENKPISRPYTPISSDDNLGYFDLLIKIYPHGKMGQHLKAMNIGDSIEVRGPAGHMYYKGNGLFEISRKSGKQVKHVKHVGMIAGGSGITPMLQIIRAIDKNPSDQTHKSLIFGNVSVDDILLKDELDAIVNKHAVTGKFKIHYCVDKKPDDTPPDFNHSVGFITPELIEKHMPAPAKNTLILVCGPKPMVDAILKHLHDKLNYSEDMVFVY